MIFASLVSSAALLVAPVAGSNVAQFGASNFPGHFEIQFMLANDFWGCNMNYGNSQCGQHIRQAVAHLIDKSAFIKSDSRLNGVVSAIDNPVPPVDGLVSP